MKTVVYKTGGSYCGLLAMASARTAKFPEIRQKGTSNLPRMQVFCSDQVNAKVTYICRLITQYIYLLLLNYLQSLKTFKFKK